MSDGRQAEAGIPLERKEHMDCVVSLVQLSPSLSQTVSSSQETTLVPIRSLEHESEYCSLNH